MNERIQELLVQSNNALARDGKIYPHIGSRSIEDWERFAELIVQECIDIVAAGGEFTSRPKLVERLQEHFGVES